MMYYDCAICGALNHNSRHHCQACGTIPKRYSILSEPSRLIEHYGRSAFITVVSAVPRTLDYKAKVSLRTVPLDYYGEK